MKTPIRLIDAVIDFGFSEMGLSPDDFTQPNTVIQLGYPPNRIDLLTSISDVDFEEAWGGRLSGELDGLPVFFLGWDELLKNKRASGRAKDLADVSKLSAVRANPKTR